MIRLETQRLVLRDYVPADEADYIRLKSDAETMRYLQDIRLRSIEEGQRDFAEVLARAAAPERDFVFLRAGLKESGEAIGSVGYTVTGRGPAGKLVHAGYFYLPAYWGQGFATEALARLLEFAFEEDGVCRVTTGCLRENRGSERVMRKCGMILEGEFPQSEYHGGRLKDRARYRLLREEYESKKGKESAP